MFDIERKLGLGNKNKKIGGSPISRDAYVRRGGAEPRTSTLNSFCCSAASSFMITLYRRAPCGSMPGRITDKTVGGEDESRISSWSSAACMRLCLNVTVDNWTADRKLCQVIEIPSPTYGLPSRINKSVFLLNLLSEFLLHSHFQYGLSTSQCSSLHTPLLAGQALSIKR